VAIEHHSPVTLIHWGRGSVQPGGIGRGPGRYLGSVFDLSIFEIFVTLAKGGNRYSGGPTPLRLRDVANKESVTLINTVPSAIEGIDTAGEPFPDSVQTINLAG